MLKNRLAIKLAGETGMGIDSSGNIIMKALKNLGFWVYGEREFASVIKGVGSNIQINISDVEVRSMQKMSNIGVAVDREGLLDCLETVVEGGVIINAFSRWNKIIKNLPALAEKKNLKIITVDARDIAIASGGSPIMSNVVLLGVLWKFLGLEKAVLEEQIVDQFKTKQDLIPINLSCLSAGYEYKFSPEINFDLNFFKTDKQNAAKTMIIDGNTAIGMGAVNAGVRACYAYPMSPSTSVLVYLAKVAKQTGMLVKQVEDEISVAQIALGSMHAGVRTLVSTSGGGFDLMTETISLSGMIETPLVVVIAQRPGPATGLPTWTCQGDLNLSIYGGHGDFARCVISCSGPKDCFENVDLAFDLAEKFQIPVVLLTEAAIGMTYKSEPFFKQKNGYINRHLAGDQGSDNLLVDYNKINHKALDFYKKIDLKSTDRYKITDSGVSIRWVPGMSKVTYFANGDEHLEDGSLTEEAESSKKMIEKRYLKLEALKDYLPEPEFYKKTSKTLTNKLGVIGWGSTKNVILDAMDQLEDENQFDYLHLTALYPLKLEKIKEFFEQHQKVVIMELNLTGQLATLIEQEAKVVFADKFLKYDGRPFYVGEIVEKIKEYQQSF